MSILYLVSTPIGNLGDLSQRAVETLDAADVVLAEDTRRTSVLMKHFDISSKLVSLHQHNETKRIGTVLEMLQEGKRVALVSDAGTPLLSDPGARVVEAVVAAGHEVVPIPGASALLAALVASGLSADRFTFYGFLPRKGTDRTSLLKEISDSRYTVVVYEAPNRVGRLLHDLGEHTQADRRVVVARELTKLHEEIVRGTVVELAERYATEDPRGEVVVVVEGSPVQEDPAAEAEAARTLAQALLDQGLSPTAVVKELRSRLEMPRNAAYSLVQELSAE